MYIYFEICIKLYIFNYRYDININLNTDNIKGPDFNIRCIIYIEGEMLREWNSNT